ncbi:MAG: hypothetical protein CALGDGBN_03294 [Pseudomonadales bacterium]|nr:hypothetical protein [Pseudomonadales bacterium]
MAHPVQDPIVRRSARLLAAVLELHKQGYQDLAVHSGMSPSGLYWRCSILPFSRIFYEGEEISIHLQCDAEIVHHTSGEDGFHYFGWDDAKEDSARDLAKKVRQRFPDLLSLCKRRNYELSGWLAYALGHAERGRLPVMYADGFVSQPDTVASTGEARLMRPPYRSLFTEGGVRFTFADPPHLGRGDDWHDAYISKIRAWRAAQIRVYPRYPASTGDIYEIGAYWEGAVYYIQEILGFTRLDAFLDALEKPDPDSERWTTFFKVWNDQGQLVYLKAFLIRKLINEGSRYRLTDVQLKKHQRWLHEFESTQGAFSDDFYNPYFGGGNPLHLGLCSGLGGGEDKLFYA